MACLQQIHIYPKHCCQQCGRIMPRDLAPGPCGACLKKAPMAQSMHSLFIYDGMVRQALLHWKLQRQEAEVAWLLQSATTTLQAIISAHDLLIPVPMPLSRMRERGQHHTANLCKIIAQQSGAAWDWRILRRIQDTPRQSTLSGQARKTNLKHAFGIDHAHAESLASFQRVWIIDDICTTGSTLNYATRALKPHHNNIHTFAMARGLRK
ncbi:MAG: ComF family protein [Zetaproteobacteria bacterium]|nr:ComF family protein [Zetaproteobacteria bacterium]